METMMKGGQFAVPCRRDVPVPTIHQWNVAVQREIMHDLSLTAAYVGSASSYIMGAYNWNGSPPGPPATERQPRQIPAWNNISYRSPMGHASYDGLDIQIERRFAQGFSFTGAYTWSHSIDDVDEQFGSGGGGTQDWRDRQASRGNSAFDTRHRLVSAALCELPFGSGRHWLNHGGLIDRIFGGWQMSGLFSAQTGQYFTLSVPNARQRLGGTIKGTWFPDRLRNGTLDERTADRWFDTTAFAIPRDAEGSYHLEMPDARYSAATARLISIWG